MIGPSNANLSDKQYLHNWFKDSSFYLNNNPVLDKATLDVQGLASLWVDEFGGIQLFEQFVEWQQSERHIVKDGLFFASELVKSHSNCIEQQNLPQQLIFLRPYIDAVARGDTVNSCKSHPIEEPSDIAFPELILPISSAIFYEWQVSLGTRAGIAFDSLAQQDIYHWISIRLETLLSPIFYDDFNSKRTQETLIQSYKDKKELGHSSTTLYRHYIEEIQFDLEKFLRKNSGLVNILCKTIQYGKRAVTLLSERVSAHHQAIQKTFLQDSTPFKVTRISIGEGDTHDQGLSVAIITVNSGSKEIKIVYKPRSIDLDHQFYKVCKILENRYGASPTEIYPNTLPLENFGFIEYVDNCPCKNKQELGLFYHNFGRLLCLSRMLSGTDIHYENLIASGRNAVLIDCETLFTPTFKTILHPFDDFPEENTSVQLIRGSVMATLMLPKWVYKGAEKVRIDMSAIGVNGGRDEDKPHVKSWFERNTDLMMPSMVESEQTTIRSLPVEAYTTNPAPDFVEDICSGFIDLYKNLHQDQSYWLGDASPLHLFKGQKQRVVFRATDFYARILSNSIQPQNLLSETHRQVSLHKLSRAFTQCKHRPDCIKIFEEEIVQLTRGDIPAFYARTNSDELFTDTNHSIDNSLIQKNGFETVYSLFQGMSDQDLALQLILIKGSLDARFSTTGQTIQCKQGLCQDSNLINNYSPLSIHNQSKRVSITFEYLKSLLLPDQEDVCWIGYQIYFGKKGISFFLLNDDLLQGRLGICCALSSFQSNHGEPEYNKLCSIVSRCAEKIYSPFTTKSDVDFEKRIDISPGLNGITGHLLGGKILTAWCHKTNNQQLKEILEQSTKAIIDHCSNHGTFLDVDCNGSLYTSAYALFNYLPYIEEYFKPDQLSNFFQAWIHQLQDLKPDALLLRHGLHEGTLGMLRAALKNTKWLNVTQHNHLKKLFSTASHKLFVDLSSSTPLSISDGIGGTLISIAEAYQQGWMAKATSVAMIEAGLQHLNQQLLQNNVQLSHDLAYGYAGLDRMLKHLNNILEPSVCQKIRLDLEQHFQLQLSDIDSVAGFKTITKSMRYQAIGPFTGVLGIENYLDQGFESQLFVDALMAL